MLIITRKENDSIIIDVGGEQIEITVTEIGKQVRLGIDAPRSCKIWRKEIYTTMEQNKEAVSGIDPQNLKGMLQSLGSKPSPK